MRLTGETVRKLALPRGVTDRLFFDDDLPGFGIRVRAGGSKTWLVQYGVAGKTRRMVLGITAQIDPGKARATAKDLLAKVRLGGDPAVEKKRARIRAAETMGAVLPLYLAHQRARVLRPNSLTQIVRNLEVYSRSLHASPIADVDRRMISALLLSIAERNGPRASYQLRKTLCAFFAWAAREGLV